MKSPRKSGNFYVMKKKKLPDLISSIGRSGTVFAPVKEEGEWNFSEITEPSEIDLKGYMNTEFPPKKFLLPEGEAIAEFDNGEVRSGKKPEKAAILGVRPCDVHGINVLDKVMLSEPVDMPYKRRRDSLLIIAIRCGEAGENCFCSSMGTDDIQEGFDLLLTEQGDHYHVETGSGKGRRIIKSNAPLFRKTDRKAKKPRLRFRKKINTDKLPEIMKDRFDSKIWEETAKRCLSCASCTSICPTCYCFDIEHVNSHEEGKGRVERQHVYCLLKPFTRVAGDNYFRDSRTERLKQFFYHKLVYGKENQGVFHCVGCGRCITECPTDIDITEEAGKIRDEYEKRKLRS